MQYIYEFKCDSSTIGFFSTKILTMEFSIVLPFLARRIRQVIRVCNSFPLDCSTWILLSQTGARSGLHTKDVTDLGLYCLNGFNFALVTSKADDTTLELPFGWFGLKPASKVPLPIPEQSTENNMFSFPSIKLRHSFWMGLKNVEAGNWLLSFSILKVAVYELFLSQYFLISASEKIAIWKCTAGK